MKRHPFLTVDFSSTVTFAPAEERRLRRWLALAGEVARELVAENVISGGPPALQVSLLICGDRRIRRLNREHRGKDRVTDVLSFPAHEDLRRRSLPGPLFLGDLAICHPQTARQAKAFGIGYFDEFIHLFFHGFLHLLGYDHEVSAREEALMQAWEDRALTKFSSLEKRAR
jgi:probable rRNA maturation factor